MILRDYQTTAITNLRAARRAGNRRILFTLPTGGGKTAIAVAIIVRALAAGLRVLVIAHRKELLDQFYGALKREDIIAGLMRAQDERTDPTAPVQLASIDSLVRRDLPTADLVFIDEAHRAPSASYARVLEQYPKADIIGLTATPCRLDGKPLDEHFDVLVQGASYSELIDLSHIMAPIVYAPKKAPDLSGVQRVAGDYHEGQLQTAMMRPHVIGDILTEWECKHEGRSTVVFAVGIEHSRAIVERFKAAGVRAAHLDGTTSESERFSTLLALDTGDLQVVSNVGVLCEGWDQPRAKYCVMARPTLSLMLFMQCVGRILRPWGVHESGWYQPPIVFDHANNYERHGLPHEDRAWDLHTGKPQKPMSVGYRVCQACYAYVRKNPCELCGFSAPAQKRVIREEDGVLERIDKNIAAERKADPKRAYFDKQVDKAQYSGFKPGYASAKYKEKYGDWPTWAWSQEVKLAFAKDKGWQERVYEQTKKREFWQAKHAPQAEPEMSDAAEPDYVPESFADDEIPF